MIPAQYFRVQKRNELENCWRASQRCVREDSANGHYIVTDKRTTVQSYASLELDQQILLQHPDDLVEGFL